MMNEMNREKYIELSFITFYCSEWVGSCPLHKKLLPQCGKICASCMNI